MYHNKLAQEYSRWYEPAPSPKRQWLTTADVAKRLTVSPRWVRWLARHGELRGEVAESGQRIFQRAEVQRYLLQRNDDRERRASLRWRVVRYRMVKAGLEPRQVTLPLFGRPKLKLARSGWSERPDPEAEVKRAQSGDKYRGSVKLRSVNQKATRCR